MLITANSLLALLTEYAPATPLEALHHTEIQGFLLRDGALAPADVANPIGHVTASAFVLNRAGTHALLTHHRKLNRWLQLGGHVEPSDVSIQAAAMREAQEESGLAACALAFVQPALFDVDVHLIPARDPMPKHPHYDLRFLLRAEHAEFTVQRSESHGLAWVALADLVRPVALSGDESLARMARKAMQLLRI